MIALVGVGIALVVFFFVAGGDTADEDTETTSSSQTREPQNPEGAEVPVIEIAEGRPVGGIAKFEVAEGDDINFVVESDAAHKVHLHTYDVGMHVPAGGEVEFNVPASIGGVIEAELEDVAEPIAEISVVPD